MKKMVNTRMIYFTFTRDFDATNRNVFGTYKIQIKRDTVLILIHL